MTTLHQVITSIIFSTCNFTSTSRRDSVPFFLLRLTFLSMFGAILGRFIASFYSCFPCVRRMTDFNGWPPLFLKVFSWVNVWFVLKPLVSIILFESIDSKMLHNVSNMIITLHPFVFQTVHLKTRDREWISQGHTANSWQSWDYEPETGVIFYFV